jgi:hypothetical protein
LKVWVGVPFVSGIVKMTRGHRLAMTAEEDNFQVWLEKNWDRPLSDEVERLQDELKRLETVLAADSRRLRPSQNGGGCSARGFWRVWGWWLYCSGT